jgi:hypothetical protein
VRWLRAPLFAVVVVPGAAQLAHTIARTGPAGLRSARSGMREFLEALS